MTPAKTPTPPPADHELLGNLSEAKPPDNLDYESEWYHKGWDAGYAAALEGVAEQMVRMTQRTELSQEWRDGIEYARLKLALLSPAEGDGT